MISPLAVVSSDARIESKVEIGPFCVIEEGVRIGNGCVFDSHVVIKSGVTIGENNRFGTGSVIGGQPQHTSAQSPFGQVRIGNGNVFREHITVHRAIKESETTVIGDGNYLMACAHVAHDCKVGNENVLVNNVMLGGHVTVGNRVNLGGGSAVHQNCRIGSLAMVGGLARVVQDVPPFMVVDGITGKIVGLNQIGLHRNGRSLEEINVLKGAYLLLYRSGLTWREILSEFQDRYSVGIAAEMSQFLLGTKRGIVHERFKSQLRVVESDDLGNAEAAPKTIRVNVG